MAGVYISYPFCAQKCTYCNFASGVFPADLEPVYLDAVRSELRNTEWMWKPETVYLGGGTPSLIEPVALSGLLAEIPGEWQEATIEAAPGGITPEKAAAWRRAGINRVSLGVQSFITPELARTGRKHTAVAAICGKVEAELAELPAEEQKDYMASYGLSESGLERLISATYSLLGLMSFLTAGEDEVRAWTIPFHSTAVKAAGAIHSDFEKKFIRAEVVNWKSLVDLGGYAGLREKGMLRLEGKEYIVKDGDVLVIRHG